MSTPFGERPSSLDLAAEEAALRRLQEEAREAHFGTDAALLLSHDAEPVLFVRDGAIVPMSRAELTSIYTEDMRGATYHEWDYLEDPIVRIADDASMAWVITRRKVRRTKRQADGSSEEQQNLRRNRRLREARCRLGACGQRLDIHR
jgi:hypothetical protein